MNRRNRRTRASPIPMSPSRGGHGRIGSELVQLRREGRLNLSNVASDLTLRLMNDDMRGATPTNQDAVERVRMSLAFDGRFLGEGAYGQVYATPVTPELAAALAHLAREGSFRVIARQPVVGDTVAIKLQSFIRPEKRANGSLSAKEVGRYMANVQTALLDALVHRRLSSVTGSVRTTSAACAASLPLAIPAFYMSAGVLTTEGVDVVTVMAYAGGAPVSKFPITAEAFVAVEQAVATVWLAGVAHADFHPGNALYDPASGKATVIDFGYGVVLPETTRRVLGGLLGAMVERGVKSLGEVWEPASKGGAGLREYTNRVLASRGSDRYNPDNRALKWLYNSLPAREKKRVPNLRRRAWGCWRTPGTASSTRGNGSTRGTRGNGSTRGTRGNGSTRSSRSVYVTPTSRRTV